VTNFVGIKFESDFQRNIKNSLKGLTSCTKLSPELLIYFATMNLLTDSEYEEMMGYMVRTLYSILPYTLYVFE